MSVEQNIKDAESSAKILQEIIIGKENIKRELIFFKNIIAEYLSNPENLFIENNSHRILKALSDNINKHITEISRYDKETYRECLVRLLSYKNYLELVVNHNVAASIKLGEFVTICVNQIEYLNKLISYDDISKKRCALARNFKLFLTEEEKINERMIYENQQKLDKHPKFILFLQSVYEYLVKHDLFINKEIFLSHAWPIKQNEVHLEDWNLIKGWAEEESWTNDFVNLLHAHLRHLKINAQLDERQSGRGANLQGFMSKIYESDHVLLISSRAMEYKFCCRREPSSGVIFEYELAIASWQARGMPNYFIIPIQLNKHSFHPPLIATKIALESFYDRSYLHVFKNLLIAIFHINKDHMKANAFDHWWNLSIKDHGLHDWYQQTYKNLKSEMKAGVDYSPNPPLSRTKENLEKEIAEINDKIATIDQKIENNRKQLKETRALREILENQKQNGDRKVENMQEQLRSQVEKIERLKIQINQFETELIELNNQLTSKIKALSSLEIDSQSNQRMINILNRGMEDEETRPEKIDKLNAAKSEKTEIEKMKTVIRGEVDNAEKLAEKAASDRSKEVNKKDAAEKCKEQLETDVVKAKSQQDNLKAELVDSADTVKLIEKKITQLREQKATLQKALLGYSDKAFEQEINQFFQQIDEAIKSGDDIQVIDDLLNRFPIFLTRINEEGKSVTWKDKEGKTLLHKAVSHGRPNIIRYLIEETKIDLDIQDNKGNTALHYAAMRGSNDIMRLLLGLDNAANNSRKANSYISNLDNRLPLHLVARFNDDNQLDEEVFETLQINKYINQRDKANATALYIAAWCNAEKACKLLLKFNADYKLQCCDESPLHAALIRGNTECVETLKGYATNQIEKIGIHAALSKKEVFDRSYSESYLDHTLSSSIFLFIALVHGNTEVADWLLQKGILLSKGQQIECLYFVIVRKRIGKTIECLEKLLSMGVDINCKDSQGFAIQLPVISAIHSRNNKCLFALLRHPALEVNRLLKSKETGSYCLDMLEEKTQHHSESILNEVIKSGADWCHRTFRLFQVERRINPGPGICPTEKVEDIFDFTIERGAKIDLVDSEGNTPLSTAIDTFIEQDSLQRSEYDSFDLDAILLKKIIKLLKDKNIDINTQGKNGQSPLLKALSNWRLFELLMNNGIHLTSMSGDKSILQHLETLKHSRGHIDKKVESFIRETFKKPLLPLDSKPAIIKAYLDNEQDDLDRLLQDRTNLTIRDHNGWQLVHHASARGDVPFIKKLITLGQDIQAKTSHDQTPLTIATIYGKPWVFQDDLNSEIAPVPDTKGAQSKVSSLNIANDSPLISDNTKMIEGIVNKISYTLSTDKKIKDFEISTLKSHITEILRAKYSTFKNELKTENARNQLAMQILEQIKNNSKFVNNKEVIFKNIEDGIGNFVKIQSTTPMEYRDSRQDIKVGDASKY